MWSRIVCVIGILAQTIAASSTEAAVTATQKCQASKNVAAAKYALCRLKAEQRLTLTQDPVKHDAALDACLTKLNAAWQKAEEKAAKKGATCSDVTFPVSQFAQAIDGVAESIAGALGGAASPAACDNSCSGKADGTTCDAGINGGTTLLCVGGTCQACVPNGNGIATRYIDNGDGTITDTHTCLVWEKKDDAGGIHDKDNQYTWSNRLNAQGDCTVAGCPPNGEVFTVFLASLNNSGFAGHNDWRLPPHGGSAQFPTFQAPHRESLVEGTYPSCGDSTVDPIVPCINPIFTTNCGLFRPATPPEGNPGCTIDGAGNTEQCSCLCGNYAWSYTDGTGTVDDTSSAWSLYELDGSSAAGFKKTFPHHVRAVRGGVVYIP